MLFLVKWSPGVKQWSHRDPHFPSWSPGALHFLGRSPGAQHPFGIPTSESDMEVLAVGRKYFSLKYNVNLQYGRNVCLMKLAEYGFYYTVFMVFNFYSF